MVGFEIDICLDKEIDQLFIYRLYYFLVSKGVRYNARCLGGYYVFSFSPDKTIEHFETEVKDSTEKLADIIDLFLHQEMENSTLDIFVDYLNDVEICFWIDILPYTDKCLIRFMSNEDWVPDEKSFLALVNLSKEVFSTFNFSFGAYSSEYEGGIPLNENDFLKESPRNVNFYSKELVDKIGRDRLLSAPARQIEELPNGGIMMLICTEPLGCDDLYKVWHHLGYQ